MVINGVVGPVLLGGAVATFFTGSDFYINKANMTDTIMPVISHWGNGWHGLDALTNIWNVILGLAVFFLARVLGSLYFINNIDDKELTDKCRRAVRNNTVLFLVFFWHLSFVHWYLMVLPLIRIHRKFICNHISISLTLSKCR